MKDKKVKILVACHKPDSVYEDEVYTPIHVGRAISKCTDDMHHMIGDDTGDNISDKNPMYCEVTAQYWAWKNLKDVEYIGLCHYRRYFGQRVTKDNIEFFLSDKYDVMLAKKQYDYKKVLFRLILASSQEDLYIFLYAIKKLYPEYLSTACEFINNNVIIGYNMFIMKKAEFDKFAKWQFDILFEMEKYIKISGYTRAKRVYGYYAEYLLPIYCLYNKLHIRYSPVVSMVGEKEKRTMKVRVRNVIFKIWFRIVLKHIRWEDKPTLTGLAVDYPDIDFNI